MPFPVPVEWRYESLESLVVGVGAYSDALASIMGTVALPFAQLHDGPVPDMRGGYPRVLENLKRALLVVPEDMSAAEALRGHRSIWNWVERLSSAGDQHDLAFVFVLPVTDGNEYEEALAAGLCLSSIDPTSTGHGVWRQSGMLLELLELAAAIRPMDALSLRARQRSDHRQLAIEHLRDAVMQGDATAIRDAARVVLAAFRPAEYHLDLFCRAPSHRHGNLLRVWLNAGVTSPVTQDWCATGRSQLDVWLVDDNRQKLP